MKIKLKKEYVNNTSKENLNPSIILTLTQLLLYLRLTVCSTSVIQKFSFYHGIFSGIKIAMRYFRNVR